MNFWDAYSKYLEREQQNTANKPAPKKKTTTKKKLELADDVLDKETENEDIETENEDIETENEDIETENEDIINKYKNESEE